jgi:hypothetical protein
MCCICTLLFCSFISACLHAFSVIYLSPFRHSTDRCRLIAALPAARARLFFSVFNDPTVCFSLIHNSTSQVRAQRTLPSRFLSVVSGQVLSFLFGRVPHSRTSCPIAVFGTRVIPFCQTSSVAPSTSAVTCCHPLTSTVVVFAATFSSPTPCLPTLPPDPPLPMCCHRTCKP